MGSLHYGSPPATFELDDRTLAHVELVVLAKLRRHESFALTFDEEGAGRSTLWISSASTLRFVFETKPSQATLTAQINRQWLDEMIDSANTTAGMRIFPEPERAPSS
ncbi:MAG: hypothetical protein ABIR17_05900 [Pseudolysinimonas sp.]|uniref:DUF7882 family protein n=1 Tax=Pseudolysinimonas sp. TaxID=2680009 RepID=UPI003267B7CF